MSVNDTNTLAARLKISLLAASVMFFAATVFGQQKAIPRDTSYNVASVYSKIKKNYPYAIPARDTVTDKIIAHRDVVYTTLPATPYGRRDLHLDLFSPVKKGSYPALIMIHGGGWRSGDKSMQIPLAQLIAAKGFVCIPVEYQLSLEARYPAAVHNIKSAIRWVRANARKYNIDPDRIAVAGASAGGQLATLVGLTNNVEKFEGSMGNTGYSSEVQAIVDIDGVVSFLAPSSLNLERKPDAADAFWFGGSYLDKPEIWKEASGGYWANEKSVPMLFLNSGFSRFHAGQDELIGQYREWGIYQEVHQFNVKIHPFWLFHPWVDESAEFIAAFLHKVLK